MQWVTVSPSFHRCLVPAALGLSMDTEQTSPHGRFRFGLRTLLVIVVMFAILLAWTGRDDRQRQASRWWIEERGGSMFPSTESHGDIILPPDVTVEEFQEVTRLFPGCRIVPPSAPEPPDP